MIDAKLYFDKFATLWGNKNQYTYFDGISLSDAQKKVVDYERKQLLINGQAGTGKSLTLIYKMLNTMAKESKRRKILYITFNETLIKDTVNRLENCPEYFEVKERHDLEISTYHQVVTKLAKRQGDYLKGSLKVSKHEVEQNRLNLHTKIAGVVEKYVNSDNYKLKEKGGKLYKSHTEDFFVEEFRWMKANGILDYATYIDVERVGRTSSIRLTKEQRKAIFDIFELYQYREQNEEYRQYDLEDYALYLLKQIQSNMINEELKYDYIYVDEIQDFQAMQIKSLGLLYKRGIVMAGDPRQSVYKRTPLSYEKLGFDFKSSGAVRNLHNNYRSTYEIAKLSSDLNFVDQNVKAIDPNKFKARGEKPLIVKRSDEKGLIKYLVARIKEIKETASDASICIVIRDDKSFKYPKTSKYIANLPVVLELKKRFKKVCTESQYTKKNISSETIFIFDPYDIKGLEFDYIFIYNFSDRVYPFEEHFSKLKKRCESNSEGVENKLIDMIEFYDSEKKLLYVAMTRAKVGLEFLVYGKQKVSRFASDFKKEHFRAINITKKDVLWMKEVGKKKYKKFKVRAIIVGSDFELLDSLL